MSTDNNNRTPGNETKYFDIITRGVGYLGRARVVTPNEGEPYPAVDINALQGPSGNVGYRKMQCSIKGTEAKRLIKNYMTSINEKDSKVMAGFSVADPQPRSYQDKETGETRNVLQVKLIGIDWVSINGDRVYNRPKSVNGQAQPGEGVPAAAMPRQEPQPAADQKAWE